MRIANITLNGLTNYGNQLQLYAMQQVLSKYGHVENVEWTPINNGKFTRNKTIIPAMKIFLKKVLSFHIYFKAQNLRHKNFKKFNKQFIITHNTKINNKNAFKKINNYFDYFVAGSDQIWNPSFDSNSLYIRMLGFTEPNKRVSIAPSIAIDTLPKEKIKEITQYLNDYKFLSCRESSGANIIQELTNKDVETLIDPTLMLSQSDWEKLSLKPTFHDDNKPYLLVYFLGKLSTLNHYIINLISKTYNLQIINLFDSHNMYSSCGPREFIYLIQHSSLVITDSFHGCIFSYIFNKPFRIFKRQGTEPSMNSRLINLIKVLNLNNEIYYNYGQPLDNILECNYNKNVLKNEQKKFTNYMEKIFK